MAYISKEQCSDAYKAPKVVDVRVPMGKEQARLYAHFLNRANVPGGHPLVRARRQTAWLRNICADPAGFSHGGPKVASNMNPKVITILELVRDIVAQGEQVLIINSRKGLSNTIEDKLIEAGISWLALIPPSPPSSTASRPTCSSWARRRSCSWASSALPPTRSAGASTRSSARSNTATARSTRLRAVWTA
jgi:hypothetical protein